MPFADYEDVRGEYDGTASRDRVQSALDSVSARLRLLLPSLSDRTVEDHDLEVAARDVVVQAVVRRLGGTTQQVRSQSEGVGPFSRTLTFTTDKSGTFPDDDLALLSGVPVRSSMGIGTIKLGRPDWVAWGAQQ